MSGARCSFFAVVVVGALASPGHAQGHAMRFRAWPEQDLTGYQISSYAILRLADANGDGLTDVMDRSGAAVLLATGRGTLERLPAEPADLGFLPPLRHAIGDVDGDGHPDLVQAHVCLPGWPYPPSPHGLWLNDGTGYLRFDRSGRMPQECLLPVGCLLADTDADGDLDLVIWQEQRQTQLLTNDGRGYFTNVTATHMPQLIDRTMMMAASDFDGDGHQDLVSIAWGQGSPWQILRNDGTGRFLPHQVFARGFGEGVTVGDVDRDGDVDILVSEDLGIDRLFMNDGRGTFADESHRLPQPIGSLSGPCLVDLDLDGDLDYVTSAGPADVALNDGAGFFHRASITFTPSTPLPGSAAAAADFDGDGDIDILVTMGSGLHRGRLYLNLTRQLRAPELVDRGQRWDLELYGLLGHTFVPVIGFGETFRALPPFGFWHLDPRGSVVLSPAVTIPASGDALFSLTIPNDTGLAGLTFHTQALDVGAGPGAAWLTNYATTRIR